MAQTIQIYRTNSNTPPTTLLSGVLSAELGAQTKLWIGSGTGNRLLLSSDPADSGAASSAYLKLAGGTLTGALTLAADPAAALQPATKQYTDAKDALRLLLTGGTLTGPLTLAADPAAALQPATKQYVDAINTTLAAADTTIRSTYLPLAGGTLTGALTLAADPAAALQPATKQYVDAKPSGATILASAPSSPVAGQLWWDSVGGQLYVYYNDGTSAQWVPASSVPGLTVPVAIAQGGTGAVTAPAALTNLGVTYPVPVAQGGTGSAGLTNYTPADASGAGLVFTGPIGAYQRIGDVVIAFGSLQYPTNSNGANALITLPIPVPAKGYAQNPFPFQVHTPGNNTYIGIPVAGTSGFYMYQQVGNAYLLNSQLTGLLVSYCAIYPAT